MAEKRPKEDEQQLFMAQGGNIRLEEAKSSRQSSGKYRPRFSVNVTEEIKPRGFIGFLKQYAVIGLIIGFVLGGQVQSLVKQLVQSFLDPLTQLLFGTALSARTFTLHFHDRSANFAWGAFVYAFLIFLFVLVTLYIVIRWLKLDKLDKKPETKK